MFAPLPLSSLQSCTPTALSSPSDAPSFLCVMRVDGGLWELTPSTNREGRGRASSATNLPTQSVCNRVAVAGTTAVCGGGRNGHCRGCWRFLQDGRAAVYDGLCRASRCRRRDGVGWEVEHLVTTKDGGGGGRGHKMLLPNSGRLGVVVKSVLAGLCATASCKSRQKRTHVVMAKDHLSSLCRFHRTCHYRILLWLDGIGGLVSPRLYGPIHKCARQKWKQFMGTECYDACSSQGTIVSETV